MCIVCIYVYHLCVKDYGLCVCVCVLKIGPQKQLDVSLEYNIVFKLKVLKISNYQWNKNNFLYQNKSYIKPHEPIFEKFSRHYALTYIHTYIHR